MKGSLYASAEFQKLLHRIQSSYRWRRTRKHRMNRTPRGEGSSSSLPSAPKKVVAILQRTVSWQRGRRGKGASAATPQPSESQHDPTLNPQQSGPPAPPPPPPTLPADEEPRSPERPVELNERGVPLLTSLPEILEAL
eukprot:scaffold95110_cov60-Phaeocystis_antarctica.AAC.1